MRWRASLLISITAVLIATAYADPIQSSEEIVGHFVDEAKLGPPRGICIGTEEECKSKDDGPARPGLDMFINFELNSAAIRPDAEAKLAEFAKALKDQRLEALSFVVEGHTDASGSELYNDGLSERRAQSVVGFLLSSGIESSRIEALGMGETRPRDTDPYDPVNRRVEMRIRQQ